MATEQILQVNAKAAQLAYTDNALPSGYTRIGTPLVDQATGAYAIIGQNAAGHVIVAFRGTEKDQRDANADAQLGRRQYSALTNPLTQGGLDLFGRISGLSGVSRIDFIGHSLGGGLAQYAAYDFARRPQSTGITTGLFTYNTFGGVAGIKQMYGSYDPAVAGRIDAFNLWAMGTGGADVVTRLVDDGHVGGNMRRVDVNASSSIKAHTADNLTYVTSFSSLPAQSPDYLHIDGGLSIAGLISSLLNYPEDGSYGQAFDLAVTSLVALGTAPRNDINQIALALTNNNVAGWLGTARDTAMVLSPPLRGVGVLLYGINALDEAYDATSATPILSSSGGVRSYFDAGRWTYHYGDGRDMTVFRDTGEIFWRLPATNGGMIKVSVVDDYWGGPRVRYSQEDASRNIVGSTTVTQLDNGERYRWHENATGNITAYDITYTVRPGDSLSAVAAQHGVSQDAILAANRDLTGSTITAGTNLVIPLFTPNLALAPDNRRLTLGTSTGAQALLPSAEAEGAIGNLVNAGYAFHTLDSWAQLPVSTLNGNGYWNTELSALITDDFRPGNGNLSDALLNDIADDVIDDILNDPSLYNIDTGFILGGGLNNWSLDARATTYVDPLVLDLNGDGVRLTDYGSNPVLFDIDNDGGSLEQTGWTTPQDGILVMDRNGNGRIDNISETFSEYFNGTTGTGGNAGTKPYRDGFAALKSQDSNNDNLFTSSDAAFNNVRVWIDSDHDGKTDAGELKTLAELSITQIDLNAQTQSGAVRDGNEILAAGRFTQGGQTKEALALNFLANPNGHTFVTSGSGTTTTTQGGMRSYTAGNPAGEVIDVTAKSVDNAYGAQGKDTLIGNAANNWLAGGAGHPRWQGWRRHDGRRAR